MDYEAQREANIQANKALLLSLGLDALRIPAAPSSSAVLKTPKSSQPKRKPLPRRSVSSSSNILAAEDGTPTAADDTPGSRRSSRIGSRAKVDYSSPNSISAAFVRPRDEDSGDEDEDEYEEEDEEDEDGDGKTALKVWRQKGGGRKSGERKYVGSPQRVQKRLVMSKRIEPKRFGHCDDMPPIGTTFESRMEASQKGIHAPPVAGIYGNQNDGAYSIALSGGYEDDVDLGVAFTFTGAGGRDLKGTKDKPKNLRTAPQSCDQSFETPLNAALKLSCETGHPVRVLRGFKLDSPFAPSQGYRYDGLYVVREPMLVQGLSKYKVCRFSFTRLPGQPPIPIQPGKEKAAEEIRRLVAGTAGDAEAEAKVAPAIGRMTLERTSSTSTEAESSSAVTSPMTSPTKTAGEYLDTPPTSPEAAEEEEVVGKGKGRARESVGRGSKRRRMEA